MGDFLGRNNGQGVGYNNRNNQHRNNPFNPGFKNCCGLAATGDEALPPVESSSPAPIDPKVSNLQRWGYVKTGLALVGAYVVIKFLYGKFVK
jgi:hypothetical protein